MAERSDRLRGLIDMRLASLRSLLLRALPGVAILAFAPSASADSLEVHVAPELSLPDEEVKAAIAAELGASIVDGGGDLGSVEVAMTGDKLAVSHRRADGSLLVRVVALPPLPADRLAMIAFVTGNLVRDQLADLTVTEPVVARTTPVVTAMPPMTVAPSTHVATEAPEVTVPLSIGIVPPLSSDRLFTSRARVRGSLNLVVGASSSIDGVSISGAADLSANVRGLQIGGAASIGRNVLGLQIGGAATISQDLRGAQIAGAASVARDMRGIQIAGAATVARDARGIQIAGAGAVARRMTGLQIAGGVAVAAETTGAQIAPINIAGHAHGLQLGVINVSDHNDGAQIGVLNFVRHGRTDVDAWAETTGLAALALRHGGRYVHNIYAIGWTPDAGDTPLVGLGLGYHHGLGGATLDLDALAWQTHMFTDGIGLLTQARATLAMPFGPVDAFVAASYNVSIEDSGEEAPVRMTFARTIGEPMSSVDVVVWPSLAVGVRGHLGATR